MKNSILSKDCVNRLELAIVAVQSYDHRNNSFVNEAVLNGVSSQILMDTVNDIEKKYRDRTTRVTRTQFTSEDKQFSVVVGLEYEKPVVKLARRRLGFLVVPKHNNQREQDIIENVNSQSLIESLVNKARTAGSDFYQNI